MSDGALTYGWLVHTHPEWEQLAVPRCSEEQSIILSIQTFEEEAEEDSSGPKQSCPNFLFQSGPTV